MLFFMVPNLGTRFGPERSQPLVQSSYHGLPDLLLEMAGRVGHFGAVS